MRLKGSREGSEAGRFAQWGAVWGRRMWVGSTGWVLRRDQGETIGSRRSPAPSGVTGTGTEERPWQPPDPSDAATAFCPWSPAACSARCWRRQRRPQDRLPRWRRLAAPPVPALHWTDCGDGFECATARVPLDYDHPRGPTISLALSRLPAGDPSRRIGSLILGAGGPGESGVDLLRRVGRSLGSEEVRARFDLVGFDPRGIIGSTPLRCFDTLAEAQAALAPFPFPVTPQEEGSLGPLGPHDRPCLCPARRRDP